MLRWCLEAFGDLIHGRENRELEMVPEGFQGDLIRSRECQGFDLIKSSPPRQVTFGGSWDLWLEVSGDRSYRGLWEIGGTVPSGEADWPKAT